MSKRIFIGFDNSAGYSVRLTKGFRQLGIKANLFLNGVHPFGYEYPSAIIIKYPKNKWLKRLYTRYFFLKCLLKYNAFLFISTQTFLKNYKDLKILRFLGKKTVMTFVGCDIQQPELTFKPEIPFSACHNCTQEYKDFVGCVPETKPIRTRKIEKLIDTIMTHSVFREMLQRDFIHINQPINIEEFPRDIPKTSNKIPVILHAPSNFGYKGTQYLLDAKEDLKKDFKFEFKLIHNINIKSLYEEISKADIIVDQLIQGWYGMLPLEAMMFKKPVVCYLRDDVVKALPSDCPIINANPDTIYEVLRWCLMNKDAWVEIGERGRKYVEKYHDAKLIASQYAKILLNI